MARHIFCDFDGTITTCDVTDLLLEIFAEPAWHDIEAEWLEGRIGSAACMSRQVALMRCRRESLDEVLDGLEIDPDFPAFVARCREANVGLTIVSDGLDYAIARILSRSGVGDVPIIANRLTFLEDDRVSLDSPNAWPGCRSAAGTCKCAAVWRTEKEVTVLVGDGRSDFCAAGAVDFVLAKDSLLAHCRMHSIPHVAFTGFGRAFDLQASFLSPTPDRGAGNGCALAEAYS